MSLAPTNEESAWLNEENILIGNKLSLNWVRVMWRVQVTWILSTECKSLKIVENFWGIFICLLCFSTCLLIFKQFMLQIFILSYLFLHWTLTVPFIWTEVIVQSLYTWTLLCGEYHHSARVLSDQLGNHNQSYPYFLQAVLRSFSCAYDLQLASSQLWIETQGAYPVQVLLHLGRLSVLYANGPCCIW